MEKKIGVAPLPCYNTYFVAIGFLLVYIYSGIDQILCDYGGGFLGQSHPHQAALTNGLRDRNGSRSLTWRRPLKIKQEIVWHNDSTVSQRHIST